MAALAEDYVEEEDLQVVNLWFTVLLPAYQFHHETSIKPAEFKSRVKFRLPCIFTFRPSF